MICHNTEKLFSCKHCSYKSPYSGAVKSHTRRHFESERTYLCELCGACFHANRNLTIHMAFKHSDARNFSCSSCSCKFKSRQEQLRHTRLHHSEIKMQTCFCGKEYRHKTSLRKHTKSVHGSDANLPPIVRVETLDQPTKSIYKDDQSKPKPVKVKKKKTERKPLSGFKKIIIARSRDKGAMKSNLKSVISTSKKTNQESTNKPVNSKNIAEDKEVSLMYENDSLDINKITMERYKKILHKENVKKKDMKITEASSTGIDCQSKLMENSQISSKQDKKSVVNQALVEQKANSYIQIDHSYCAEKQPVINKLNGRPHPTNFFVNNTQQAFYINPQQNNYINLQQNTYVNLQPAGYIQPQPLYIPLFTFMAMGQ